MKYLKMNGLKFLSVLILGAALTRLLPHYPNLTAIGSIALFGGATFSKRWQAFLVPLAAMLLTDAIIGFHPGMYAVYLSFAFIVLIGQSLQKRMTFGNTVLAVVMSSVSFFIITNFAMWATGTLYPKNLTGLGECFLAAIPFFHFTLLGDLFFSAVLFGAYALVRIKLPKLVKA